MSTFMKQFVDLIYPRGPVHEPKDGGFMDSFRQGIADNIDTIRTDVQNTAFIRNPDKTPIFGDLEREYGIAENNNLSLAERVEILKSSRYKKATTGNDDDLQSILDTSGFALNVYNNSPNGPAVDPAIFLDQNFVMQAGDLTNDFAGQDDAYAGRIGGELLVNGDTFDQRPNFFGAGEVWSGNDNAVAGFHTKLIQTLIEYDIPTDPGDFPLVFFVGGAATFAGDGSLLTIEQGLVSSPQEMQLKKIILKFKPLFTWCGLIVTFT